MDNIKLKELKLKEDISYRAIKVCKAADMISLFHILNFYYCNGVFMTLKGCGEKTEAELIKLCRKYKKIIPDCNIQKNAEDNLEGFHSLSDRHKNLLFLHFKYLTFNLSTRASNGIMRISGSGDINGIIGTILPETFNLFDIPNIGKETATELNDFIQNIIRYIGFLLCSSSDQLVGEHVRLLIKTRFHKLPENFEEEFTKTLNIKHKVKLFALIKFLIDTGIVFPKIKKQVFESIYISTRHTKNITIANELNISGERVRQVSQEMVDDLDHYFMFISIFYENSLANYSLDDSKNLIIVNSSFVQNINRREAVNFNIHFYGAILKLIHHNTHTQIKCSNNIPGKFISGNIQNKRNYYFVSNRLTKCFNFNAFIDDVADKLNRRISKSYTFCFRDYTRKFYLKKIKALSNEIQVICKKIIVSEFCLKIGARDQLTIVRNTPIQTWEYIYEYMEQQQRTVKLKEITRAINKILPTNDLTENTFRSILGREKERFIFFGRSSTYGLRKWEKEMHGIKGGTIKGIVEEYLTIEKKPKHISDIWEYVSRYRTTSMNSILTNLKKDTGNKFTFIGKKIVGLRSFNLAIE
ncbi:MAG: hypothetical protein KKA07_07585 [Bacteroidetes bacterium]|nr:hypothetical protein [Bacteroidota bacterium]MBU1718923.1 hypothetical protein [Bacteroidota bacterium]